MRLPWATTIPHLRAVYALRFSADGKSLLIGNPGPTTVIDVATGRETAALPASRVVAISADANVLAGFAGAGKGFLWDVRAGRETATVLLGSATGAAISPDGKTIAMFQAWNG